MTVAQQIEQMLMKRQERKGIPRVAIGTVHLNRCTDWMWACPVDVLLDIDEENSTDCGATYRVLGYAEDLPEFVQWIRDGHGDYPYDIYFDLM